MSRGNMCLADFNSPRPTGSAASLSPLATASRSICGASLIRSTAAAPCTASQAAHWECGHVVSSKWKAVYRVATVTRTYRQIVADHRRQYPYQVKLANAGVWRDRHCSHKAREIMPGPLVQWFEGGL